MVHHDTGPDWVTRLQSTKMLQYRSMFTLPLGMLDHAYEMDDAYCLDLTYKGGPSTGPGSAEDGSHHIQNNPGPINHRSMSVPPPSAHSHMYSPPMPPVTSSMGRGMPLDNPIPAHGGPMPAHAGMGMPQGGPSVSTGSSPLVVPQPVKMTRPNKTYHCRMCDQIFDSKSDLLVHSQHIHKQDPKPYKCPTCQKCFANSSYLSQHARIHAGIKPYKCQICERKFTQLCHLQQHMRTHTGEKPYKCSHPGCGKAFTQLSNLQSHSRSHMTDKPYRCNSCYKCYADEQSLREHIPKHSETKHLKTHICRICGKSYTQETYLARHMQKHSFDRTGNGNGMKSPGSVSMNSPGSLTQLGGQQVQQQSNLDHTNNNPMGGVGQDIGKNSAFMPLGQFNSSGMNPVPSSFSFHNPRLQSNPLRSPLPHLTNVPTSNPYFPFDPFPKSTQSPGLDLLSLQQIKSFSQSHSVFPKSEPSSPVHKDFS